MKNPLAAWVHARHPSTAKASKRVQKLPESETKRGKAVPFPYKDAKKTYLADFDGKEINRAIEGASVRRVPLAGLHAIQHSVNADRVQDYIDHPDIIPKGARHPRHRGKIDHPIVVEYQGTRYIHDGHHRLTARKLAGAKDADVRFVNLDRGHKD